MNETRPPQDPYDSTEIKANGGVNILAAKIKTLEEELVKLDAQNTEQDAVIGAAVIAFQDMAIMLEELIRQLIFDGTEDGERKQEFLRNIQTRRQALIKQINDNAQSYAQGP